MNWTGLFLDVLVVKPHPTAVFFYYCISLFKGSVHGLALAHESKCCFLPVHVVANAHSSNIIS